MTDGYVCVWSNGIPGPHDTIRRSFRVTCGYVHGSAQTARTHLATKEAEGVAYRCDFMVCRLAAVDETRRTPK